MDLNKLIELYPRVYHMAERGAWDSIRTHGLMSATAVLDHLAIEGGDRARFESEHRNQKMDVRAGNPSNIVLRDQKPMPEGRLIQVLTDGTTPRQWYELINHKVFFWAEEQRLHRLLGARDYRKLEHDVLTLDSATFIPAYAEAIWLCHMNSGNTWPMLAVENYYVVRAGTEKCSSAAWSDQERSIVCEVRWWSQTELARCDEDIYPPDLTSLFAEALLTGGG
jgi:hypothetical protein